MGPQCNRTVASEEEACVLSATRGHSGEAAVRKPGRQSLPDSDCAATLTSSLQNSENTHFCSLTEQLNSLGDYLPHLWYFVMGAQQRQVLSCLPDASGVSSPPGGKALCQGLGWGGEGSVGGDHVTHRQGENRDTGVKQSPSLKPWSQASSQPCGASLPKLLYKIRSANICLLGSL